MFNGFINKNWPELDRYETAEEAEAAYVAAKKRATSGGRQFIIRMCVVIVVAASIGGISGYLIRGTTLAKAVWFSSIRTMIIIAASGLVHHWLVRSAITKIVREDLNRAGHPTCLKCGYDLRGNPEFPGNPPLLRCPECGARHVMFYPDR